MIEAGLANAIRAAHVLFVLFLLGGLVAIPAGMALRAAWVDNPWFRWPHFAASIFLVMRIWMGAPCPLSRLEHALHGGQRAHWTDVLLFRNMENANFSAGVIAQGVMSGLFLIVCPPRWRRVGQRKSPG